MGPLISVVVTTYNQGPYIQAALNSVLAQTFTDYEIIVVNDGSNDDTHERVAAFGRSVTYIRQDNTGVAGARNRGVGSARGDSSHFSMEMISGIAKSLKCKWIWPPVTRRPACLL